MSYPTGDQYFNAVQNPKTAFSDSDLRAGLVETTPHGLPRPYSGGFATAFKMTRRGRSWAVRCFKGPVPGLEKRYREVERLQKGDLAGLFVEAEYLPDGIRVGGDTFPVVKMEWVQGRTLSAFIESNLSSPDILRALSDSIQSAVRRMQDHSVAHGDLQHGNVLAYPDGRIVLIDYDGIYTPALAGAPVNELGHINYQHPARAGDVWDDRLDCFPSIVLCLALQALATQPALWDVYETGENVLFSKDDFIDPDSSALLRDLEKVQGLGSLVGRFREVCKAPWGDVPTLKDFLSGSFKAGVSTGPAIPWYAEYLSQYDVIEATDEAALSKAVGSRVEVVGRVTATKALSHTGQSPHSAFVNFGGRHPSQTFSLIYWGFALSDAQARGKDPLSFKGKWISVTGVVGLHEGKPQILVDDQARVSLISRSEADKRLNRSTPPPSAGKVPSGTKAVPDWLESAKQVAGTPLNSTTTREQADKLNAIYGSASGSKQTAKPKASAPTRTTATSTPTWMGGVAASPTAKSPPATTKKASVAKSNPPKTKSLGAGLLVATAVLALATTWMWLGDATPTLIPGEPVAGELADGDQTDGGRFVDLYQFRLEANQEADVSLMSNQLDPLLRIEGPDGLELRDDDSGEGQNSFLRISGSKFPRGTVTVTTYAESEAGSYELTFTIRETASPSGGRINW